MPDAGSESTSGMAALRSSGRSTSTIGMPLSKRRRMAGDWLPCGMTMAPSTCWLSMLVA